MYGVRLREVQIDKEHICLSFGADGEMLRVELLHGLSSYPQTPQLLGQRKSSVAYIPSTSTKTYINNNNCLKTRLLKQ